jgi:hypothetical protein
MLLQPEIKNPNYHGFAFAGEKGHTPQIFKGIHKAMSLNLVEQVKTNYFSKQTFQTKK